MIHGHGDDIFRYSDIRANFSSNVYNHFDPRALYAHLAKHMECLAHYPAPAPEQMERRLAETLGIDASAVMVSSSLQATSSPSVPCVARCSISWVMGLAFCAWLS